MKPRIRAILCDIDGTLLWRGEALPGAADAVAALRERQTNLRFLTNITSRYPAEIAADLVRQGISVEAHEVMTAMTACVRYLEQRPGLRCHFILPPGIRAAFARCVEDDKHPQAVVMGDVGAQFDYETLNRAFRMIRDGAELIALQRNLFWFDAQGARLDCGAFVTALEAATGVAATVVGKPARRFFAQALDDLGMSPSEALVIGDDPDTDLSGAFSMGARALLVRTGKSSALGRDAVLPHGHGLIDSIAQVPNWIDEHGLWPQVDNME